MNKIKNLLIAAIAMVTVASCATEEKSGWTINGTIDGITNGTLFANNMGGKEFPITDGKFTITSDSAITAPMSLGFTVKEKSSRISLFVENGVTVTYYGKIEGQEYPDGRGGTIFMGQMTNEKIEGGVVNGHAAEVKGLYDEARKEYNEAVKNYRAKVGNVTREQIDKLSVESEAKVKEIQNTFIKNNPTAYYSAVLLRGMTSGKSKEEIEKLLAMVSPEMNNPIINKLRKDLAESKDVKISDLIKASNVSYKVDTKFDGTAFKDAKYLGVLSNGNLVALNNDKTVTIIDGNGKKVKSFAVSTTAVPGTMAVDSNDNIFVLVPEEKEVEKTVRGKQVKVKEIASYSCDIYDVNGKKTKSFKVEGVKQATGARVADGKLMVADMRGQNIGIFNASTGAREAEVKGMRPCCGILDFSINSKNEILVANLGAFRVQGFDLTGKQLLAFGSRGNELAAFHGCCNPVSVAYLSNGAIVTVEKDPTRVKVYSNEGAIAIAGIDEMVKGCSYIPMTVDKKDNLYLASPTKGVVRCVAI